MNNLNCLMLGVWRNLFFVTHARSRGINVNLDLRHSSHNLASVTLIEEKPLSGKLFSSPEKSFK